MQITIENFNLQHELSQNTENASCMTHNPGNNKPLHYIHVYFKCRKYQNIAAN